MIQKAIMAIESLNGWARSGKPEPATTKGYLEVAFALGDSRPSYWVADKTWALFQETNGMLVAFGDPGLPDP